MSGHSKWKTIKHKKGKEDEKRGKIFTRVTKEITVAARDGGGDPASNARLRFLLEKAKSVNMPKENVERAIKKGTGKLEGSHYEHIFYEGYGASGTAVIIEALTDNKNRTVSELRHFFNKNGGVLADVGAVSWMFEQLGTVEVTIEGKTEDQVLEELMDCPADDIKVEDEHTAALFCHPKELDHLRKAVEALGFKVKGAHLIWHAKEHVEFADMQAEEAAIKFMDGLEDQEDVQNIYTNF